MRNGCVSQRNVVVSNAGGKADIPTMPSGPPVHAGYGGSMTPATAERHALADLFAAVGPDEPTLCEGWSTRDLAAHIVMRERRPDASAGILVKPLAGYAERVRSAIADTEWSELVHQVRTGPPRVSPMRLEPVDRMVNTVEFFVHHEDVRRAAEGHTVRALDAELAADLRRALERSARILARRAPVGLVLEPTDGGRPITAHKGDPSVTVRGPIGELVLFAYGRQAHASVELDGPSDAVAAIRAARLGL
jgi:uncharacterized protein (TIGR03085 family)